MYVNQLNKQQDFLIIVWLYCPWTKIQGWKWAVIEAKLNEVLLAEPEQKLKSSGVTLSFILSDISLHCLFKGWWYLHTTEEGPGVSRSEGGPQQRKCHFILFILLSISPLWTAILFSCLPLSSLTCPVLCSALCHAFTAFFYCLLMMVLTCLLCVSVQLKRSTCRVKISFLHKLFVWMHKRSNMTGSEKTRCCFCHSEL